MVPVTLDAESGSKAVSTERQSSEASLLSSLFVVWSFCDESRFAKVYNVLLIALYTMIQLRETNKKMYIKIYNSKDLICSSVGLVIQVMGVYEAYKKKLEGNSVM